METLCTGNKIALVRFYCPCIATPIFYHTMSCRATAELRRSLRGAAAELQRSFCGAAAELQRSFCGASREHPQTSCGASADHLDGHPSGGVDFLENFGRSGRHGFLLNSLTKMEPFGRFRAGRRRGGVQGGVYENGNLNISLEVSKKIRF